MFNSRITRPAVSRLAVLPAMAAAMMFGADVKPVATPPSFRPLPDRAEAELAIKKFRLLPGLKADLWASEPMLANPVAFCIDERGRVFVSETFRLHQGVTDIRRHMNWLDEELAAQSTGDLITLFQKYKHDGQTNTSERITMLQDTTGAGRANRATVYADRRFSSLVDGIASGLVARRGHLWFANIPHLWRFRDNDGDGRIASVHDLQKPILSGFGVRVGFLGHDLHGLIFGPDGKLYFSIGDRGANVKTPEGHAVSNPETGAIYRCHPDGTGLEIFHLGLRNPQELAFDDFGNLFTGDNNSDGGDPARWVYAIEGGDTGWRIGWQFIESAPWTTRRGPWLAERMCYPQFPGQAAYIVPPLANLGNGPSGLAHYPGTGLPERFDGHFFLADFKGGSANSGIWTFKLKPRGASFEMLPPDQFVWNVLVTDVDFGYDGHVYFSDWLEGWDLPGKGRIYRISDPTSVQSPVVAQVKELFSVDFTSYETELLQQLLAHRDRRVRQEAHFTLVERGADGLPALAAAVAQRESQTARLHGIWGLGMLATAQPRTALNAVALDRLRPLLTDAEAEIRAQAARALGEARDTASTDTLMNLLADESFRVRSLSAIALGKLRVSKALPALARMLAASADQDPFLRHSGVMGLIGCGDPRAIAALRLDASASVRLAAVVALRRLESAEVGAFLADPDPLVVLEAARAISEGPITAALPQLAALEIGGRKLTPESLTALNRRILSANYRLGTATAAQAIAAVATATGVPEGVRAEAFELLADWAKPSGRDRITGLWRPIPAREAGPAAAAARPLLAPTLRTAAPVVRLAAIKTARQLSLTDAHPILFELVGNPQADPAVRVEALKALAGTDDTRLAATLDAAAKDRQESLRVAAASITARRTRTGDPVAGLAAILAQGTLGEKQNALLNIGGLPGSSADKVIAAQIVELVAGRLPHSLRLEALEAAGKRTAPEVTAALEKFRAQRPADDLLWNHRDALEGGNAAEGQKIFLERAEASCSRCHRVGSEGGDVGPALDGIGRREKRELILESIVAPNVRIAPGFEPVVIVMKAGQNHAGMLKSETAEELVVQSPEDGLLKLKKADIAQRQRGLSSMPDAMVNVLSKRDIRDLVEFLASLK